MADPTTNDPTTSSPTNETGPQTEPATPLEAAQSREGDAADPNAADAPAAPGGGQDGADAADDAQTGPQTDPATPPAPDDPHAPRAGEHWEERYDPDLERFVRRYRDGSDVVSAARMPEELDRGVFEVDPPYHLAEGAELAERISVTVEAFDAGGRELCTWSAENEIQRAQQAVPFCARFPGEAHRLRIETSAEGASSTVSTPSIAEILVEDIRVDTALPLRMAGEDRPKVIPTVARLLFRDRANEAGESYINQSPPEPAEAAPESFTLEEGSAVMTPDHGIGVIESIEPWETDQAMATVKTEQHGAVRVLGHRLKPAPSAEPQAV